MRNERKTTFFSYGFYETIRFIIIYFYDIQFSDLKRSDQLINPHYNCKILINTLCVIYGLKGQDDNTRPCYVSINSFFTLI